MAGCGSALSVVVTGLALLLTLAALSMYHGYGFVQYDRLEDVQAALDGEKGRLYKGYRLGKENCSSLSWPQHAFRRKSAVVLKPSGKVTVWHLSGLRLNQPRMYLPPEFLLWGSPCCLGLTLNFYVLVFGKLCWLCVRKCATSKPWKGIVETSSTEFNNICKPKLSFILTCSKEFATALSGWLAK